MKKFNIPRIAVLSMLALLLALPVTVTTGCKTTGGSNTNGPSTTAIDIAIGIQAVVPLAVANVVKNNTNTIPYFVAAAAAIAGVSSGTNYNASAVIAAIEAIPTTGNGWEIAKVTVEAGINLYAGLQNAGVFTAVDANYDLAALAAAIKSGLPPVNVSPAENLVAVKARTAPARAKYATILKR